MGQYSCLGVRQLHYVALTRTINKFAVCGGLDTVSQESSTGCHSIAGTSASRHRWPVVPADRVGHNDCRQRSRSHWERLSEAMLSLPSQTEVTCFIHFSALAEKCSFPRRLR